MTLASLAMLGGDVAAAGDSLRRASLAPPAEGLTYGHRVAAWSVLLDLVEAGERPPSWTSSKRWPNATSRIAIACSRRRTTCATDSLRRACSSAPTPPAADDTVGASCDALSTWEK